MAKCCPIEKGICTKYWQHSNIIFFPQQILLRANYVFLNMGFVSPLTNFVAFLSVRLCCCNRRGIYFLAF